MPPDGPKSLETVSEGKAVDIGDTLYVASREEWRGWLACHHWDRKEIWLIYYKAASGKPSVPYGDSVEEAICYGWIDGMIKSVDERKYARRFTPRQKRSQWSRHNVARAERMLRRGKVTEAGMAVLPADLLSMWSNRGRSPTADTLEPTAGGG